MIPTTAELQQRFAANLRQEASLTVSISWVEAEERRLQAVKATLLASLVQNRQVQLSNSRQLEVRQTSSLVSAVSEHGLGVVDFAAASVLLQGSLDLSASLAGLQAGIQNLGLGAPPPVDD